MENDKLEQFVTLKEQLTHDLSTIEVTIARIEQEYEQILPELKMRKDALVHALFDEAPVEITLEDHETDSASYTERVVRAISENPGFSKQELREILPDLTHETLTKTLKYCSSKNLIENRGSKQRPKWYLAE